MKQVKTLVAFAALAAAGHAAALSLVLRHSDGEFVDRGTVRAEVSSTSDVRLDCAASAVVARNGNDFELTVTAAASGPAGPACNVVAVDLGQLAVGNYEVRAVLPLSGASESATQRITVLPLEGRCNAEPALQPALMVAPNVPTPSFVQRMATDAAYARALGNPLVQAGAGPSDRQLAYLTYPPLVDPTVMSVRLRETGDFQAVYRNAYACLSAPPPDRVESFLEFYHAGLDQFFYTADPTEIAAIDRGDVGAWSRTGARFAATTFRGCAASSAETVVYRFAGKPGVGSHFFTRERTECAAVERSAQWDLEGIPFYAAPLVDGTCDAAHAPLYRAWRPFGVSNHRFTTDTAIVSAMTARGWIAEGAVMCVRKPG